MKYNINYFIKFFKSKPVNKWTIGGFKRTNSKGDSTYCALGFCRYDRYGKRLPYDGKESALDSILDNQTIDINDNSFKYSHLGKTPRARILRALELKKAGKSFLK